MAEAFDVTAHVDRATDALNGGRPADALAIADEIRRSVGPAADEALIRGIALSQTGQTAAAGDAFAEAIRQAPSSHKARFNAAIHEFNAGNISGATELARAAAALDPEHGGTRELLARIEEASPTPPPRVASAAAAPIEALAWVGRLGSVWLAIALVLFGVGLAATALQFYITSELMPRGAAQKGLSDVMATSMKLAELARRHPLAGLAQGLWFVALFGTIGWTILDLFRRMGNLMWLAAVIPLSCLGLPWLGLMIYLLFGRRPASGPSGVGGRAS